MSRILEIIRRVVREELASQRGSLLGVVTAVHAHKAEDDDNNYEVDVRLKHEDLELRRIPVAVEHAGVAAPPRVSDLVLVQFVNGDINQPLVTGRFYHANEHPPFFEEGELVFEHRVPDDNTLNHLRFTHDGTIYLQRNVTKPKDNSAALTTLKIDGSSGDIQIKAGDDITITVTNNASIKIVVKDKPFDVECDTMTVKGKLKVTDGTTSTTISGNEITGAMGA